MILSRVRRATIPINPEVIPPRSHYRFEACPQVPFKVLELWTHSPGPSLWIHDIHAGNYSLLPSHGAIAAENYDIVAVTEAVRVALAAGYRPEPGARHPFYDRLKIESQVLQPGYRLVVFVENRSDREALFSASVCGLVREDLGSRGDIRGEFDQERMSDLHRFDDLVPASGSKPKPKTPPGQAPPASKAGCPTCGALAETPCYGTPKGKSHPARGRKLGECPGCPLAAWAGGLQSTCMLCGKKSP